MATLSEYYYGTPIWTVDPIAISINAIAPNTHFERFSKGIELLRKLVSCSPTYFCIEKLDMSSSPLKQ